MGYLLLMRFHRLQKNSLSSLKNWTTSIYFNFVFFLSLSSFFSLSVLDISQAMEDALAAQDVRKKQLKRKVQKQKQKVGRERGEREERERERESVCVCVCVCVC